MAENYIKTAWRRAWIMWDLDNGHAWGKNDSGKGYMWVFPTKKEALAHKKEQSARKHGAKLSAPFKIEGDRSYINK